MTLINLSCAPPLRNALQWAVAVLDFPGRATLKRTDALRYLRRAVIYNLNFELYSEVTNNSTKLGSTKGMGVWGGIILFLLEIFIWIVLYLRSTLRPSFALTWKKFFDRAYCLVK